jgi:hypothetical protein
MEETPVVEMEKKPVETPVEEKTEELPESTVKLKETEEE